MPMLLLEIGCEELPASACVEAEAQLPGLVRAQLGLEPSQVYVTPRRIAFVVDELPENAAEQLVKGPPVSRREQAAAGFAKKHGLAESELEEQDGHLWARVAGEALRGEPLLERLRTIVHGLEFGKSMRWDATGRRFARPVRWVCEKLDDETLWGAGTTFGHRFTHGEIVVPSAQAYAETLRAARVEPDATERRRQTVDALDALGEWEDPLGKLDEVVYMVEWPLVFESAFDERFLRLPSRVVVTAMQSHQRYFPLGANRFAVVAAGGEVDVIRPGYTGVLNARLEDATFTFDRDAALGIEELAQRLGRITFFEGGGTYADKTERLVALVERLGGGEDAVAAARLAKADQASELVREFPDLEGAIGAEYARLAGQPEDVCRAIEEHYLPGGAEAPLPSTEAGRLVAAADKSDTLGMAFSLGHRPTGSRDPYGLRRAAIGLCRLAVEGGVTVSHELVNGDVREFVVERLEGLLEVPVEFTRAARRSAAEDVKGVADRARLLAGLEPKRLSAIHEVYVRSARLAKGAKAAWKPAAFEDAAEQALADALDAARPTLTGQELDAAVVAAETLAPVVNRFFEEVMVMHENEELRNNRLGLLADVRDTVGALGDFSEIPV
jgi:glycyl-tRNA synthetase beta chain